tara:strand:- start:7 stop:342 length:336 start_codon:yes stop_codon:yes gene_type:complete
MELTRMEKILFDNDLEKMLNNHLEDAEDMVRYFQILPSGNQQFKETWEPQINYYKGKIAGLKQTLKLLKLNKMEKKTQKTELEKKSLDVIATCKDMELEIQAVNELEKLIK